MQNTHLIKHTHTGTSRSLHSGGIRSSGPSSASLTQVHVEETVGTVGTGGTGETASKPGVLSNPGGVSSNPGGVGEEASHHGLQGATAVHDGVGGEDTGITENRTNTTEGHDSTQTQHMNNNNSDDTTAMTTTTPSMTTVSNSKLTGREGSVTTVRTGLSHDHATPPAGDVATHHIPPGPTPPVHTAATAPPSSALSEIQPAGQPISGEHDAQVIQPAVQPTGEHDAQVSVVMEDPHQTLIRHCTMQVRCWGCGCMVGDVGAMLCMWVYGWGCGCLVKDVDV